MSSKTNLLTIAILVAAVINCLAQPVINTDPQSQTNVVGTDARFTVLATGTEPLAYQWRLRIADLAGKTNDTLTVTNVQSANAGDYTVVVTNMEGAVTSVVATLTVLVPPNITKQPTNQTASLFADATFRVTATGDAPLSYQWRFNDGELIGRTNTTLTVTNVQRTDAGNYSVLVTNLSGSVTSRVLTLTITPFNSLYCFGFSWTGSRGCNFGTPADYWHGHPSNGPQWPEYFSTNLDLTYAPDNNYAQCGATSSDILNQVIGFRAPPKANLSLYCLWADGPDADFPTLMHAVTNEIVGNKLLQQTLLNNSNALNRLYTKGAREILIEVGTEWPTNAPWTIQLFGTNTALLGKYNQYVARHDTAFIEVMNAYSQARPDLRLRSIDVMSNVIDVMADPGRYGFTETSIDALADPSLTNKSFTGPGADYMFWDGHPTTKLHKLIAERHLEALTNSILEKLDVTITGGSPNIQMNHLLIGRDYTLQSSSDLSNWQDLQTFTAATGTNQWTGALGDANTAFYRLKWQP